jgi:hypothetical protein
MRRLIQPLPYTRCECCGCDLLLKCVEAEVVSLEIDIATYLCPKCGKEHLHRMPHDRYTPLDRYASHA